MIQQYDIDHLQEVCDILGIKYAPALTRPEAQTLRSMISENISTYERYLQDLKQRLPFYYENSNPEDPNSEQYFIALNNTKDTIRYLRKRINKFAEIQRKLRHLTNLGG